jgi:colanic acid biosynthesis glycosyl transferase WcaI
MLSDLAESLAATGWNVTVITSRTAYDGETGALETEELREGVHVHRVGGTRFGRSRMTGRVLDYLSYTIFSFLALLRMPQSRIIVAMSDPPFILLSAVIAARLRGAAVCYWAQDVYPTLAARVGVLNEDGIAFKLLSILARRLLRACNLVVGLGSQMVQRLIQDGAPADKIVAIHNWADEKAIRPIPPESNWFLANNNLQDRFVVLYSGNAGRGHTFDALCEVMLRCRDDERIVFVFIGGGRKSNEIRAYARAKELSNVRFFDYLDRIDIPYSLSAASVSIVTEDPSVAGLLFPSKTYGILASGRPMIFIGSPDSDVAKLIENSDSGIIVRHDDADGLERAIRGLARDPSKCVELGEAARRAAESAYSRRQAVEQWSTALRSLIPKSVPTQV